mgnify:CR=1 FL=1
MNKMQVTKENLPEAVKVALAQVDALSELAKGQPDNQAILRDLTWARKALTLIDSELTQGLRRPIGSRSAMFIRYVLDEGPNIVLAEPLRTTITQIEDVYARY